MLLLFEGETLIIRDVENFDLSRSERKNNRFADTVIISPFHGPSGNTLCLKCIRIFTFVMFKLSHENHVFFFLKKKRK